VISLVAAVWAALRPDRSDDFALGRGWLDYWTSTWTSPYPVRWLMVDYPPHALVLLWPLDWLPGDGVIWFLALNLMVTSWLAWALTTWAAEETGVSITARHHLVFACMLLTWGAMRAGLLVAPISPAHSGSLRLRSLRRSPPPPNGWFTITAMPRSRATSRSTERTFSAAAGSSTCPGRISGSASRLRRC